MGIDKLAQKQQAAILTKNQAKLLKSKKWISYSNDNKKGAKLECSPPMYLPRC